MNLYKMTSQENTAKLTAYMQKFLTQDEATTYMIIDGDRTLIPVDSTRHFFQLLQLDFNVLKSIFQEHGYSFEAFYKVATFYSTINSQTYQNTCAKSAKSVSIYPEFLTFIDNLPQNVKCIVVTSGLREIWGNILQNHQLDNVSLIGGNYFPKDTFVIDPNAKKLIVNLLKNKGKNVSAFGDSLIDFEMLKEADRSFLIVNEKQNKDIIPFVSEIQQLQQISFTEFEHKNIPKTKLTTILQEILTAAT
ncbi:HAD family hydrolase [Kordia sp.]|uniref:HAD family hydrolase n=1 Tax=Kordia sp. TaxID=1965332 RepID=UPI003D2DE5CC